VSGQRVGCQRVSSRVQHPQRQLDGIVLVRTCPDRLLGSDVDRPQLTEVLRFVRAGDMVTVHPRAGGRRRTTGLVPVRHTTASTPASTVAPGVRGRRRSRPARRMRRCCVVSPGDSRGAGFGVECVSRRSRRLLVTRSRVDGLDPHGLRRCRTASRCGHRWSGSPWCPRVGWCVRNASICRLLASRFH